MISEQSTGVLARAGLEVVGALGSGADGLRWAVRDAAGTRWAATVIPRPVGGERVRLRNRIDRLAALDHPHLVRVGPLVDLPGGGLVVLQREVPGADLRTVRAGRGGWSPGEVVTVVVPLAEALAALHGAGLVHGDVAPGNVVLDLDGRPVLVDLVCSDGPTERGTPGFAAPERGAGATPAGDVYALARLGFWLGEHDDEHDDEHDGGAGRGDDLGPGSDTSTDPAASRLRGCLRAAVATEQRDRPGAADLARDVYASCVPEPVRLPEAAVLTQVALRRLAGGDDLLTERAVGRPRGRHRRPAPRRGRLVLGATLAVVACGTAVGVARGALSGDQPAAADERTTTSAVVPIAALDTDPVGAAIRLTVARARALGAGDGAGLARVTVPGSAAAAADQRTASKLGGVVAPVEVVVNRVARRPGCPAGLAGGPDRPDACVRVLLDARVGASPTADAHGDAAPSAEAPEGTVAETSSVVLVLRPTLDGWLVSEVEPAVP